MANLAEGKIIGFYEKLISSWGIEEPSYLDQGFHSILFKAKYMGNLVVLKLSRLDSYSPLSILCSGGDYKDSLDHIVNEHKILQNVDIKGVPKIFDFFIKKLGLLSIFDNVTAYGKFSRQRVVGLVKEYIPGKPLRRGEKIVGKENKEFLEKIVASLHKSGVANIDFGDGDIIVGERGKPYLIDFGLSVTCLEVGKKEFQIYAKNDFLSVERVCRST